METTVILCIAGMNLIAFLLMGYDKYCARKGKWRVSEATRFSVAALFGALGGTIGMFRFRHKTKHLRFRIGFPLLALLQLGILIWLVSAFL